MASAINASLTLARRELIHFKRQRGRLVAALATPLILWLIAGMGLGEAFRSSASIDDYLEYFFPGMISLTVMFAAIFGAFSTIQDKQEGFMQAVLVAPVPRWAIAGGKILGGATIAAIQGLLMLPLAWVAGIDMNATGFVESIIWILLISLGQSGLGLASAWWTNSTQSFHGVMNMVMMPMWILSGAAFPMDTAYTPIQWAMKLNPLHYGVEGLRSAMYSGNSIDLSRHAPGDGLCLAVTIGFALALIIAAAWIISSRPFTPVKERINKRRGRR